MMSWLNVLIMQLKMKACKMSKSTKKQKSSKPRNYIVLALIVRANNGSGAHGGKGKQSRKKLRRDAKREISQFLKG